MPQGRSSTSASIAHARATLFACAIILGFLPRVHADETPRLVRDLNPYGSYPLELTVIGENIFFASRDLAHGDELWRCDGTASHLVADLAAGPADFAPKDLVAVGSRLLFRSAAANRTHELWTSDGTPTGTQRLVALPGQGTSIEGMRSDGERAFLRVIAPDRLSGSPFELWVSDGTSAGTFRLPAVDVSSFDAVAPAFANGKFFFTCNISRELWVTDGTVAGTTKLATQPDPAQGNLVATTNGLVFAAWNELWVSNGTPTGTSQVLALRPSGLGSFPFNLTALGERLVFFADDGAHGVEPWITDGTAAGTRLLRDIAPGPGAGIAPNVIFHTETSSFLSHRTIADTTIAAGNRVFFLNESSATGRELWSTDGTAAGTALVTDLWPGEIGSVPRQLTALGNRVVFVADGGGPEGRELWLSDGTPAGTRLVRDLAPGIAESRPAGFTPYRHGLVFRAYDGVEGTKLWFTDGTSGGTLVLDNRFSNSHDTGHSALTASGRFVFFNASTDDGESIHLGRSDGTAVGTDFIFGPIPTAADSSTVGWTAYSIFPLGHERVLWTPWAPTLGSELWYSDGSFAGTGLLHDFSGEMSVDASTPTGFARLGDRVFLTAFVGRNEREFFQLDLQSLRVTPAPLANGNSRAPGGYGYHAPESTGDRIFFNTATGEPGGWQTFVSTGPGTSTELLGLGTANFNRRAHHFTAYRGHFYFTLDRDTRHELWRTDGTANGSTRFAPHPDAAPLVVVNDKLLLQEAGAILSTEGGPGSTRPLFTAQDPILLAADATRAFFIDRRYDGESYLYVTDGTGLGTRRAASFERWGLNETVRAALVQGVLFFRARDAAHGHELWRSDGTAAGTRLVADLWPGPQDGASDQIAATSDGRVFYFGRHPLYGYELFTLTPDPSRAPVGAGRLGNLSARFTLTAGGSPLTVGFVVRSSGRPTNALVRGIGPSLVPFGVDDAASDSTLQIFSGATTVGENDDWQQPGATASAALQGSVGAFPLPAGSRDAAWSRALAPGPYTAQVSAPAGGAVLAEVYQVDAAPDDQLVNLSCRQILRGDDDTLIAGFVLTGDAPRRVLIRGIGPGLAAFGVKGTAPDPAIEVRHGATLLASNNDWALQPDAAEVAAAYVRAGAFTLNSGSKDAALLLELAPGAYTAVLRDTTGQPGEALVEIYALDPM